METRGKFRVDPGCLEADGVGGELEVVVPYTEPLATAEVLRRVPALTAGLSARVVLIAVHTLPYPLPFVCPALVHAHLVEQLTDLASGCALPVHPQVVLARDRELSVYDALTVAAALDAGCQLLLTEDLQHGEKFGTLTVENPFRR